MPNVLNPEIDPPRAAPTTPGGDPPAVPAPEPTGGSVLPAPPPGATPAPGSPAPGTEPPPGAESAAEIQDRYIRTVSEHEAKTFQLKRDLDARDKELSALKERITTLEADPYAAVEHLGGTREEYANRLLNDGQPTPESKISQLEDRISQLTDMITEQQTTSQKNKEQTEIATYMGEQAKGVWDFANQSQENFGDLVLALEYEKDLGRDPMGLLSKWVDKPIRDAYSTRGRGLTPAEIAATLNPDATKFVEKIRNSTTLRKIFGLEAGTEQPGPAPARHTITDGHVPRTDPGLDLGQMSNDKFAQYVASKARKPG